MDSPATTNYAGIILALFLVGYWTGVYMLLYHLIRFGIGTHPRRLAFILLLGSIVLTILAIALYMQIN